MGKKTIKSRVRNIKIREECMADVSAMSKDKRKGSSDGLGMSSR